MQGAVVPIPARPAIHQLPKLPITRRPESGIRNKLPAHPSRNQNLDSIASKSTLKYAKGNNVCGFSQSARRIRRHLRRCEAGEISCRVRCRGQRRPLALRCQGGDGNAVRRSPRNWPFRGKAPPHTLRCERHVLDAMFVLGYRIPPREWRAPNGTSIKRRLSATQHLPCPCLNSTLASLVLESIMGIDF